MPKLSYCILPAACLCLLVSCASTKNIAGSYRSSFAIGGFFGTKVKLKPDSTLEYVFRGHMMHDSATGKYKIRNRKVYLLFDKEPPDSNKLYYQFDIMPLKQVLIDGDTVRYQLFYYIGRNKLFEANNETGKKVTKAFGYSHRRKYWLFGKQYYDHRYYYKRIE